MTAPAPAAEPRPTERFVEVPAERLTRWVERFLDAHGPATVEALPGGVALTAADGSRARLESLLPPGAPVQGGAWRAASALARHAAEVPPLVAVAVRRGGWAVGVVADGRERTGKAGRSYVQSRTAAGGSSQGRYARRRANQAARLAGGAAEALARLLAQPGALDGVTGAVLAGDRELCREVLADAGVDLPVVGLLAVGDPRRVTLAELAERVRAVRVHVVNAPAPP